MLIDAFTAMRADKPQPADHAARLAAPLCYNHLGNASMAPITPAMLRGNWHPMPTNHPTFHRWGWLMTPAVWQTEHGGAALAFRFKGSRAMLWGVYAPDAGQLEINVDDRTPAQEVNLCNRECPFPYLIAVAYGLDTAAPHKVHVQSCRTGSQPPGQIHAQTRRGVARTTAFPRKLGAGQPHHGAGRSAGGGRTGPLKTD